MDEAKKVALVTGGNSGIGLLTVRSLATRGHVVVAGVRESAGRNAGAVADLRAWADANGARVHVVDMDVTSDASVEAAIARAIALAGRVDVVVNNAGRLNTGHTETFTEAQVQALFDTNVFGPQRVNRAVLPHFRARGTGLLVHLSSSVAAVTLPFMGLYAATKRALEGIAEGYRYELAPLGIDSVIVQAGGFPTPIYGKIEGPADVARAGTYGPLADAPAQLFAGFGAMLQGPDAPDPQDVADAIVRLVETPAGARPLRTVVDRFTAAGVLAVDAVATDAQRQAFAALGLGDRLQPRAG